ncbi:Microcystin-dependent protein [Singulisphaera sp. GP187]|uniref:phage tail protein n=1 Tax=Singulisphaera sp. GP187 TaxID=1882752 RepID=UPI000929D558|nr:tail fiber protein [Singulisphaera sp. GP187]SIO05922.1 Microcystin-dependent protein [Singulisphaera sp. GP187]
MLNPFLGQILAVPYNFAPRGWALCNGQILPISQNTALFSLLGTTYGGNGQSTFALPDLRGRVPINAGQGPGLSDYSMGEADGSEAVTLPLAGLPSHSHGAVGFARRGRASSPAGAAWAASSAGDTTYTGGAGANAPMSPVSTSVAGSDQGHENRQPYLALNFIIALQGIFPARG